MQTCVLITASFNLQSLLSQMQQAFGNPFCGMKLKGPAVSLSVPGFGPEQGRAFFRYSGGLLRSTLLCQSLAQDCPRGRCWLHM